MNQFLKRTLVTATYLLVVMGLLAMVMRQHTNANEMQSRLANRLQHAGWHVSTEVSTPQHKAISIAGAPVAPVVDAKTLNDIIEDMDVKPANKLAAPMPAPKPKIAPKPAPIVIKSTQPAIQPKPPIVVAVQPKPASKPVVHASTPKPAPIHSIDLSSKDFYAIQVASYEDEDRAYDTIATLMDKGYMAWLENSGDRWRVMVGHASTSGALSYDREQLQILMKLPQLPMLRHVVGSDIAR